MSINKINPATLYDGAPFGMSQAAADADSGLIFISGQVDWDSNYQVKNQSMPAQAEGAIKNLLTVLEAANSSVQNLLHLRVYIRGELAEHMETIVPILLSYLGTSRPALTGIGVASLATPDTLIEIEAVAKRRTS
ncbi:MULTISPECIES: RidA family protein [Undibacterium]|uniref:RidA family protein n=1 Tax=Undibacterium umbellatum TaxID=2762300 RepID=A0ABR6Z8H6_9BURK|nr:MULTISPECIES: RidA family protein [Undibacterium]MBC3907871.1 RidA family protein [Undibacterium umbellatum]MDP1979145.1 RidA family protein [Undibacterium sp.]